jgi:hypothetical protein
MREQEQMMGIDATESGKLKEPEDFLPKLIVSSCSAVATSPSGIKMRDMRTGMHSASIVATCVRDL